MSRQRNVATEQALSDDMVWALRLVRQGRDEAAVVRVLMTKHSRYGHHSRMVADIVERRGIEAARVYASTTARKAAKIAATAPRVQTPGEAREALAKLRRQVDAEPWPLELAGARRALEAAYAIGQDRGRIANFKLDLRTHAMRAGQSVSHIRKHRRTLHALGWLLRDPRDRAGRTSRFTFPVPPAHVMHLPVAITCVHAILAHDAWRPGGLGDEAWYVQALEQSGASLPQDAAAAIARLEDAGLRGLTDDDAIRRQLDLYALRQGTFNSGYHEGMGYRRERQERARHHAGAGAVSTCAHRPYKFAGELRCSGCGQVAIDTKPPVGAVITCAATAAGANRSPPAHQIEEVPR